MPEKNQKNHIPKQEQFLVGWTLISFLFLFFQYLCFLFNPKSEYYKVRFPKTLLISNILLNNNQGSSTWKYTCLYLTLSSYFYFWNSFIHFLCLSTCYFLSKLHQGNKTILCALLSLGIFPGMSQIKETHTYMTNEFLPQRNNVFKTMTSIFSFSTFT